MRRSFLFVITSFAMVVNVSAAMKSGTPDIRSLGSLAFGPDGYLYLGLGDGGRGGDPFGNGQNIGALLGSILRIDVAAASEEDQYRIPPDNPFVDIPGAREEIWAYGLRNPWRFSFDTETGWMWAADVGQNRWEEIDIIQRGRNYGWSVMEGDSPSTTST